PSNRPSAPRRTAPADGPGWRRHPPVRARPAAYAPGPPAGRDWLRARFPASVGRDRARESETAARDRPRHRCPRSPAPAGRPGSPGPRLVAALVVPLTVVLLGPMG